MVSQDVWHDSPTGAGRNSLLGVILFLAAAALFFTAIWSLPITDPDESRCCIIVQNMLQGGDWLSPHIDGRVYYDKPAPFFWLAAAAQKITCMEMGGRAVAAIAGIAAVMITFAFTRRLTGSSLAGFLAGIILATSPEFFFIARWYRMDMPFMAGLWGALWWFARYEFSAVPAANKHVRWLGFYCFCALAALMKGPLGLVLPVLIVSLYFVLTQWRRLAELLHVPGIVVFLLIAAPWYAAISISDPHYAYQFFFHQNLGRYAGESMSHSKWPGIMYVAILFGGMFPWSILLPAATVKTFPRKWSLRGRDPVILFLWVATVFPLIFFGVAKTKMANYILPSFAPAAVLMAMCLYKYVSQTDFDKAMRDAMAVLAGFLMLTPAALLGFAWYVEWLDAAGIIPALLTLCCACMCIRHLYRSQRKTAALWACASTILLLMMVNVAILPEAYEMTSYRQLGRLVRGAIEPQDRLACIERWRSSFALYAGRLTTEKIKLRDAEAIQKFSRSLNHPPTGYFMVYGSDLLENIKKMSPTVQVLAKRGEYYVFTNAKTSGEMVEFPTLWAGKKKSQAKSGLR